jgi:hypothetical protein
MTLGKTIDNYFRPTKRSLVFPVLFLIFANILREIIKLAIISFIELFMILYMNKVISIQ